MSNTYYKDHWIHIEPERLQRYKQMFEWSDTSRPLLEPAGIQVGDVVVDLGCGPGFTAMELAAWVGPSGQIHGLEVNEEFVEFGRTVAEDRGLDGQVRFHHISGSELPFSDSSIDCVVAKNVLVYVDDPIDTYRECHRILKKGGRVHAVEGDWGLSIAEPVPERDWKALIDAASIAFRTPNVGRRLFGYAKNAGFVSVDVSVVCRPDLSGRLLPMVRNLCTYARHSGELEEQKIRAILNTCEEAAICESLLILNPQFVVTATS